MYAIALSSGYPSEKKPIRKSLSEVSQQLNQRKVMKVVRARRQGAVLDNLEGSIS